MSDKENISISGLNTELWYWLRDIRPELQGCFLDYMKRKEAQETVRCRECEGLYLVPPYCDYTVSFSNPDCLNCSIDNEKSRQKKREKMI